MRIGLRALSEQHRCSFRDAQQQHCAFPAPKTRGEHHQFPAHHPSDLAADNHNQLGFSPFWGFLWLSLRVPCPGTELHLVPQGVGRRKRGGKKLKHIKGVNKRLI